VDRITKTRKSVLRAAASVAVLSLAACADISHTQVGEGEAPVVLGPAVRNNITPLNDAYACYANKLAQNNVHISVGVSDIRDYTGKASDLEGTVVTQGGPMMAYSALGKLKPAVELHERFDTRVAELELAYIDRRQLGTGQTQTVNGQQVPWIPYYGGTILESDYYLVGGITEVNYNVQSGGFSGSVDLIGPRARVFTLSVGLDLRLVNTKTLVVESTASLQKQIVGYEVGVGIFKFFGDYLVDFDAGVKNQEPIQLGVRTTMELGILQLLGDVTGVFYEDCVSSYFEDPSSFDRSKGGTNSDSGAVIQNDAALPLSSGIEGVESDAAGESTVEASNGNLSDAMRQELMP
jgi:curli biogenesis system outer membrane secretion channel CsgG